MVCLEQIPFNLEKLRDFKPYSVLWIVASFNKNLSLMSALNNDVFQSYFKDYWNTFDFVTVVGSIVDALMVEFAVSF